GTELDRLRVAHKRCEEHHAAHDVLALFREVLADESVVKAQPVREYDGLAVLVQGLGGAALHGVERHGEVAQTHAEISRIVWLWLSDDTHDPSRVGQPREETVCPERRRPRALPDLRGGAGVAPCTVPDGRRVISHRKSIITRRFRRTEGGA